MKWRQIIVPLCLLLISTACLTVRRSGWSSDWTDWDFRIGYTTGGGLWLLANFAYGGMRAQGSKENTAWRVLAFIFGFPGHAALVGVRHRRKRTRVRSRPAAP